MAGDPRKLESKPSHERHFYSSKKAFGRFGIRIFDPVVMEHPHWHGHIEVNLATGFEMTYLVDGETLIIPPDRLVIFWAGVPHQLTAVRPVSNAEQKLCNLYLPLDAFLMMHQISALQVSLLSGGMVVLPENLCSIEQMRRWYADYRSGDFERQELVKMELNVLLRRASLNPFEFLRAPKGEITGERALSSAHIRHVIAMVRFILENLDKPLKNADIAATTGLHENYAQTLFARIMQVPPKQFLIRMRLMRARALLVESAMAITSVAEISGFSSISQFYAHFKAGYGMSPAAVREQYLRIELK
jgi:AraC family transcriptional regulator, melibiose operon regulatory protein